MEYVSDLQSCGKKRVGQEWLLMRGAQELRKNHILSDVVLVVDGSKLQPCHKFVLAASSPYFRAMFSHGMVEQNKKEIDIMGVDKHSLQMTIDYLYTAEIAINDYNVQSLMTTCSLLQISGLYGICRDYMIRRVDLANCISVYKFAKTLFCTKLEEEAFQIISRKFNDLYGTPDFLTLDKSELISIISSDDLWITREENVYEAAILWMSSDIKERSRVMPEVFSHIRFSLMNVDYINSCILDEELLDSFPNVKIQVESAKEYLGLLEKNTTVKNQSEVITQDMQENTDEKRDITSGASANLPAYYVQIGDLDRAIRIPLNVTPRAGMNTKEFLLFTNGRKTFVLNPESPSEYYGCIDGKPQANAGDQATESQLIGWAPEMMLMKNPEAYVTTDGTAYLFGGLEVEKEPSTNIRTKVFSLQPESLVWKPCSSMPNPRCMAAYGDGCGNLYALGGKALSHGEVLSKVHKYDKLDNSWKELASMPIAIYGHGAASIKDKIYVIGGKTSRKELMSNVHSLNCESHQWTELKPCSVPRFLHGVAASSETGEIFVVGGSSEDGVLNCMEVYNSLTDKWRFGESFPGNRCAQFVIFVKDELHTVGGYVTERNVEGRFESHEMNDIYKLDKSSNQWTRVVRRIKGATACSLACVKMKLNMTKFTRSRFMESSV